MQVEWRGTDQDPDEGDFGLVIFFFTFFFSYLLTVLPPHGEDAHQEGEGGHDYLQKLHQHSLTCFSLPPRAGWHKILRGYGTPS